MEFTAFRRSYMIGTCIVWVAIILATAVALSGTPYFAVMLPILGSGTFWFVILIPSLLYRMR